VDFAGSPAAISHKATIEPDLDTPEVQGGIPSSSRRDSCTTDCALSRINQALFHNAMNLF
jgi:hypothetical protein